MRLLVTILLFCFFNAESQNMGLPMALGNRLYSAPFTSDSVIWNFSLTSKIYSPARNVIGDPSYGIRTDVASNGWTISSVATANWSQYPTNSNCAIDAITGATTANAYFTEISNQAGSNAWFNYGSGSANYDPLKHQLEITGLSTSGTYEVSMTGCDGSLGFDANPMLFRIVGATSSSVISFSGDTGNQTNGAFFTIQPDGTGKIRIWVNTQSSTPGPGSIVALIYALKIKRIS